MKIEEYADRDMLTIDVANRLAGELEQALLAHDQVSFAVPGGSTPGAIFDMLSSTDLDWGRVHVMLTDERWVPETSPQSNGLLVRSRLLTSHAAAAQFLSYYRAGKTPAEAAPELASELEAELPLSVLMLGMGADMHTASLFPDSTGLAEALSDHAPPVCPVTVPGQDFDRITLSAVALDGALSKHLVIFGEDKLAALRQALHMTPAEAPIMAVLDGATVHWAE